MKLSSAAAVWDEGSSSKRKKEIARILWKFKRNISFYFDSTILLSVKQIILQKLGVKNS